MIVIALVLAGRVAMAQPAAAPPAVPAQAPLSLPLLLDDVLARHPTVAAAAAAWQAAAARYPQVVSLDDPMFDWMMAPASLGSNSVDFAYVVQGRQKLPWWGKRPLRGAIAAREAQALHFDVANTRILLVQMTKEAYYEYFLAARSLVLNAANAQALGGFRGNALRRYESNLVSRQDILLADVELAQLARRRLELERQLHVGTARINTLLLRDAVASLPPAPENLPAPAPPLDVQSLRALAFQQRPDLAAAHRRLRAEQAALALACREYRPDLELVGRYDTFWQRPEQQLQGQVGLTLNVPLARQRRHAAVCEAQAKVQQRRAEWINLSTEIQFQVQDAHAQLEESRAAVALFSERLIPAAQASVESADAGYIAGSVDFLRVIEAQRQLITLREQEAETLAEYHRRWSRLERVVAGPLAIAPSPPHLPTAPEPIGPGQSLPPPTPSSQAPLKRTTAKSGSGTFFGQFADDLTNVH